MSVGSVEAIGAATPAAAYGIDSVDGASAAAAAPATARAASSSSTSFAGALSQAMGALPASALPGVNLSEMAENWSSSNRIAAVSLPVSMPGKLYAAVQSATGSSSLDFPAELRAYGNGRIPRERLQLIGIGQHVLWGPAAEAFASMRAAAGAEGVAIGVTDSYRTYDQQVDLAARKGLYKNGGYAAVPGTSPHGWGLAVDVDVTPDGLAWLRANAARFGFVEAVPREPWHWEFHGLTG